MTNYRHLNMVFTYVNYLKSWECELTTDREHRIKYYGYGATAYDSMLAAVDDYSMPAKRSVSRSKDI